jgi:hypothetical protein
MEQQQNNTLTVAEARDVLAFFVIRAALASIAPPVACERTLYPAGPDFVAVEPRWPLEIN